MGDILDLAWYWFYMTYLAGFIVAGLILTMLPDRNSKFSIEETLGMAAMWWLIVIWMLVFLFRVVPGMFSNKPARQKKSSRKSSGLFFK